MASAGIIKPASMNYANMIEEKNLKKTFIIATLISTVIGTFTTGVNLYERVGEKRKQNKKDRGQDSRIRELEEKINDSEKKRAQHARREEELENSLRHGGPMIRQEYNRDLARLGPKFAEGDAITQNQLQSQIITLQGTVIGLLEDALYTGRIENINKLYNASEFAREGSISALQAQYQRMLQGAPLRRPIGPIRRISSTPTVSPSHSKSIKARLDKAEKVATQTVAAEKAVTEVRIERDDRTTANSEIKETAALMSFDASGPLFCRYSVDLQETDMPLEACFSKGGSQACPLCGTRLGIEPGRVWKVEKELVREKISTPDYDDEVIEERVFLLSNRFIVKCHREKAGFSCVLCYRHRDRDTICESANGLIRHIWQKHDAFEYESDRDIREASMTEERISKRY